MLFRYLILNVFALAPLIMVGQIKGEDHDLSQTNVYSDSLKLSEVIVPGTIDSPIPTLKSKGNGNTLLITGLNQHSYKPVPIPNGSRLPASKDKGIISPPTEWKHLPKKEKIPTEPLLPKD